MSMRVLKNNSIAINHSVIYLNTFKVTFKEIVTKITEDFKTKIAQ